MAAPESNLVYPPNFKVLESLGFVLCEEPKVWGQFIVYKMRHPTSHLRVYTNTRHGNEFSWTLMLPGGSRLSYEELTEDQLAVLIKVFS